MKPHKRLSSIDGFHFRCLRPLLLLTTVTLVPAVDPKETPVAPVKPVPVVVKNNEDTL